MFLQICNLLFFLLAYSKGDTAYICISDMYMYISCTNKLICVGQTKSSSQSNRSIYVAFLQNADVKARTYCKNAVVNTETTVNFSSSAFCDLRHEDTRVARYMLIVHPTCNAET